MNEQELKGAMNTAIGAVEKLVGRVTGDVGLEAVGAARQAGGEMQARAGNAQAMVGHVAERAAAQIVQATDQTSSAVARLGDEALDAYDRASARARQVGKTLGPFIRNRPYAALGLAAGAGLILGLILIGRGPTVAPERRAA